MKAYFFLLSKLKRNFKFFLFGLFFVGTALGLKTQVFAEQENKSSYMQGEMDGKKGSLEGKNQDREKFEVLGSRIKRTDIEGTVPLVIIDRKALELSGKNSLSDVLRDEVSIPFGIFASHPILGSDGITEVTGDSGSKGVRGQNTLILLNNRRIVTEAGSSRVDLTRIPVSAIERIEILKAGSSTYGSDAIGGVINVITRKESGIGFHISHIQPFEKGGMQPSIDLILGHSGENYNISSVIQYSFRENIRSKDRKFSHPQYTDNGGLPGTAIHKQWMKVIKEKGEDKYEAPSVTAGTLDQDHKWVYYTRAASNCPEESTVTVVSEEDGEKNGQPQASYCKYRYSDVMDYHPEMHHASALFNADFDLNVFQIFSGALLTYRTSRNQLAANPFNSKKTPSVFGEEDIQGLNNSWVEHKDEDHKTVGFWWRFVDYGPRKNEIENKSVNTWLGLKGSFGGGWDWQTAGSYGLVQNEYDGSGYALADKFVEHVKGGTYDMFATDEVQLKRNQEALKEIMVNIFENKTSHFFNFDMYTTGELLQLPYGPLNVVFGGEFNFQTYELDADENQKNKEIIGTAASFGKDDRSVYSLFAEANTFLLRNFEMSLDARFDHYSDFGSTINPRASFKYQPINGVLFRGNMGTSFKAPDLDDLFSNSYGYPSFKDSVACYKATQAGDVAAKDRYCSKLQYLTEVKPNKNLDEETALTASIGTLLEVKEKDVEFYIGTDLWAFWVKDVIGALSVQDLVDIELDALKAKAEDSKKDDPSEVIRNLGPNHSIVRDETDPYTPITKITQSSINKYDQATYGVDFFGGASFPFYKGFKFSVRLDYSINILNQYPVAGVEEDRLGKVLVVVVPQPRWRGVTTFGLKEKKLGLFLKLKSVGGYSAQTEKKSRIPAYHDIDIGGEYLLNVNHSVTVGINNLIYDYPLDGPTKLGSAVTSYFYTGLYDPVGRYAFIKYKYVF